MPVCFKIESVVTITNRGVYIFAQCLNMDYDFWVTEQSTLGGVTLNKYLDIPRITDEKGEQRYDIFVFHLKNPDDKSQLLQGQIVELLPS